MALRSELRIDSRIEEVARARGWLVEHAAAEGFPEHEVRQLGLVVSEACANVVEHAYDGRAGNPIDLTLDVDERGLTLSIRDVGVPFDAGTYAPPDLSIPQEGGYGVHIIRSVMDSVQYDTSGVTGTTLTMMKRRGP